MGAIRGAGMGGGLKFGALLVERQEVCGHSLALTVNCEAEAICQQKLEHRRKSFGRCQARLGGNVKAVGIEPIRAAEDEVGIIDAVGSRHERQHGYAAAYETGIGKGGRIPRWRWRR